MAAAATRSALSLAPAFLLALHAAFLHVGGTALRGWAHATLEDGSGGAIDAIYNFGDSISDTGNLLREGGGGFPVGHLPYGETIGGATGRHSDGLLMIDYLAGLLRLPYLPPYLDKSSDFYHGVNFAVGGATALDPSFSVERGDKWLFTNNSLNVQVQWFKSHLNSTCNSQDCAKMLERALFLIGEIGGNDYNYAFFEGKSIDEVKTQVPHVVNAIVHAIKEVINLGATQLIVPGNFPIGCYPVYLSFIGRQDSTFDRRNCLRDFNEFAEFHNEYLQSSLDNLRKDYPDVLILYGDYYNTFLRLLDNADIYGFDPSSLLRPCCGEINFNHPRLCGMPDATLCSDPAKFIHWDGVHLTQEAYKNMAKQLFQRWSFTHTSF